MSPRTQPTRRLAATATVAIVLAVTGCSRGDSIENVDATTTPSSTPGSSAPATTTATTPETAVIATNATPTTVETTTTAAPTTTATTSAAPTTTATPTTTTALAITPAGLTLSANGVGPFEFGGSVSVVLAGLTAALGTPNFDNTRTYPTADGDGYLNTIEEESFTHPVGRTVCFANDLCAQFGGETDGTLAFTGWETTTDAAPKLFTADGITIGSVMSDFLDSVDIASGGCYTVGSGDASGVTLTLLSSGEPFGSFDDEGNYVIGSPPPDYLKVLSMSSGDLPYFLYEDC